MSKVQKKSNKARSQRKKSHERVISFRERQKESLLKKKRGEISSENKDVVFAFFKAISQTQEDYDGYVRAFELEDLQSQKNTYSPATINLQDIWLGVVTRSRARARDLVK